MRSSMRRAFAAVMGASLVACGEGATTAPSVEARVVVHAVLDPRNAEQVVLVERTLGSDGSSAAGDAISGARVTIIGPGGDTVVAVEKSAGLYRVASRAVASTTTRVPAGTLRIVPGCRYRLIVETPLGVVRGTTRMPRFNLVLDQSLRRFNLDADSLRRPRASGEGGGPAGYLLRHEVAGLASGERIQLDSNAVLLAPAAPSDDRSWAFGYRRTQIHPGMIQRFIVVAVDSNYYEYSQSGYDPFGHDARGNRLEGGVGLFGAVALQVDASLDLVADRDHPVEGEWAPTTGTSVLPIALRLYESPRFPGPSGAPGLHLWGSVRLPNGAFASAEASLVRDTLQLTLALPGTSPLRKLLGTFDGETLTITVPGTGTVIRYGKQ